MVAPVSALRGRKGVPQPQLGRYRKIEAGRHHAGDQEILVVQADVLADDGGVGGEAAAPQAVAQHHFALPAGLVFALLESAAQYRLDAERGEGGGAHQRLPRTGEGRGWGETGDMWGAALYKK